MISETTGLQRNHGAELTLKADREPHRQVPRYMVLDNRRTASYFDVLDIPLKTTSVHRPENGKGYEKNSRPRATSHFLRTVRILSRWFCLYRCV